MAEWLQILLRSITLVITLFFFYEMARKKTSNQTKYF